ncbi:MAG: Fur family transcriptional regulator [Inconstantimicrobium porci]|uniref:Fur family transcriptional regulator n=1 Tax=Inconstantimicrobium porci TaxID=2652291 RepID=UPI002A90A530|nr:Fur family transcriptional regulator [Inconstantimicrobium porci]MDY5911830.1 Fur family transcriptional regulator [Inconstantimicrobium porci]
MERTKIYIDKLKKNDLKATNERIEMIKLFLNHPDEHFSIEDIETMCRNIGTATIYRNVKNFKKCSIIDKVASDDGRNFYTLSNEGSHSRTYLVCSECGRIIDYKGSGLAHMNEKIKLKYGFEVSDICCEVYGCCSECRKSKSLKIVGGAI